MIPPSKLSGILSQSNAPGVFFLNLTSSPSTGTVGVASSLFLLTASNIPSGTSTVTLTSSSSGTFSPASITLTGPVSSLSSSFTFTPSSSGSHTITVNVAGKTTPIQVTFTASAPVVPPPAVSVTKKYRFQQDLLFQRAHVRSIPHTYVNHLGQTVNVPAATMYFDGSTGSGSGVCGSTPEVLCRSSQWLWGNKGGDWVDKNGVAQGSTPFATTTLIPSGAPAGVIDIDVTDAMKYIYSKRHWCALFIKIAGAGTFKVVGPLNATSQKSTLDVTTTTGTDPLTLWYAASMRSSTSYTNAQDDFVLMSSTTNGVLEFFRPADQTKTVTSAVLHLQHGGMTYGSGTVQIYVVSPFIPNPNAFSSGLAAGYPLDANIASNPNIAVAVRVTDQTVVEDILDTAHTSGTYNYPWVKTGPAPTTQRTEANFSPYLWTATPGVGDFAKIPVPTEAQLNNMLPRRNFGKFLGSAWGPWCGSTFRVVHSDDALALSRGFQPLAPGMGAIEVVYPKCDIKNGQSSYSSLTTGSPAHYNGGSNDLDLWFNEKHIGKVVDGYIRMYVRLGDGWDPDDNGYGQFAITDPANVGKYPEEYGQNPQTATWRRQDRSGKFPGGIQQLTTLTRVNTYVYPKRQNPDGTPNDAKTMAFTGGGYSSSSGILGYQGRWMFWQGFYKQNHPGPACGGLALGVELYDFNGGGAMSIPSQNYISGWDGHGNSYATHKGGLGFLYPRKWYCVEMRWKMNSTKPYELPPRGTDFREGGHNVDGFIEWWVDGIHASKTPMFAHRSTALIVDWALQNTYNEGLDTNLAGAPHPLRAMTNVPPELFMGATSVAFNSYYGGRTPNDTDKYVYFNGLVVSSGSYIGPMSGVNRENGGLG